MNVRSVITIDKDITVEANDENGFPVTIYLAYVSVSLNREHGQCQLNLQILDKEHYAEYCPYIFEQIREFMEALSAYTQGSMLEPLGEILPSSEEANMRAAVYLNL